MSSNKSFEEYYNIKSGYSTFQSTVELVLKDFHNRLCKLEERIEELK